MVRLSASLVFLAALTVGFTSPLVKRVDDNQVLRDMEWLTSLFKYLENGTSSFSESSTAHDANELHDYLVDVTANVDRAGSHAAEAGPFTPTSSSQAVQSLVEMEANILPSMYGLIGIKPYIVGLGYAEQIEKDVTQMHAKMTLFANTVWADLPSYLQDQCQSVETTIDKMFSQATIAYSESSL